MKKSKTVVVGLCLLFGSVFSYYNIPAIPMPSTVHEAQAKRNERSNRLVKWWYNDYIEAKFSFGNAGPEGDGGVRSYRRIAAVLLTEGASAASKVEEWTSGIQGGRAGTDCP